ncbi:hypothetical protein ACTXMY_18045 [Glutamicibacter ardleyensis]|uniref:hypothetical protein n=1 Tax=Glutamicibacter ardleyensis TaxID=225894 RepID=UPI003FD364F8
MAKKFGANYLGFADPACGGVESLPTYWFQDTKRVKTTQFVEAVISYVVKNGQGKHLIFFGASAGGFAALKYSSLFARSLALVMNPRINLLARPDNFQDYSSHAYPGWSESTVKKLVMTDVSKIYSSPTENTVIYLQNLQDKNYHGYHYIPFLKKALSENKIYYKTGKWGKGHVVPPREVYEELLEMLITKAPNWNEAL